MDDPQTPSLHHLALGARDVRGLADFYRDLFNLPERGAFHAEDGSLRSVWLSLGQAVLMIEKTTATDERHIQGQVLPGLFLLALRIPEADRSAWEQRLTAAGAPVEQRTDFTLYARDPEGNRFAVSFHPLDARNTAPIQ